MLSRRLRALLNRHYERALSVKPNFDIALANMGNAVKDTVRLQSCVSVRNMLMMLSLSRDVHGKLSSTINAPYS